MQKTACDMRISDWSSDVCSSDLAGVALAHEAAPRHVDHQVAAVAGLQANPGAHAQHVGAALGGIELFEIAGFSDLAGVEAELLQPPLCGGVTVQGSRRSGGGRAPAGRRTGLPTAAG